MPACDIFVVQWTILRRRVWRAKHGGKGRKCTRLWANIKGREMAMFEEWVTAWGAREADIPTMVLRCTVTQSDGHTICNALWHAREYQPQMHYTTSIWNGMPKILSQGRGGK